MLWIVNLLLIGGLVYMVADVLEMPVLQTMTQVACGAFLVWTAVRVHKS